MSQLIRITYVSRSTFKPFGSQAGIEPNVARILSESRRNNMRRDLVGVLYYGNGCFFQCLEGNSQAVDRLLDSLRRDPRHRDLEILSRESIQQRSFLDWNMKYVSVDHRVQELLKRYDMRRFDPYQFTPEMTRQLVDVFQDIPEPLSASDIERYAEAAELVLDTSHPLSVMDRIVPYTLVFISLLGILFTANLVMVSRGVY